MKTILTSIITLFAISIAFPAFALTVNCKEHDDHYNKITFTLNGKKGTVHHIKSNVNFNVVLTGKMGDFNVYESPSSELSKGKTILLYNSKSNVAYFSTISLGLGNRIHDKQEDDLICK